MFCRICGHDNGKRAEGPCGNCGFELKNQNLPLSEQRSALRTPLPGGRKAAGRKPELWVPKRSISGYIAVMVIAVGVAITIFILSSFDRAEYEQTPVNGGYDIEIAEEQTIRDSLPLRLSTDIVYEFSSEGTSAVPRTNVDLALIPVGTRVSFLGNRELSIRPVVAYMTQKMAGRDFMILEAHNLYCWSDSTMADFQSVPLVKPYVETPGDTVAVEPVLVRFLFSEEWLRGEVQEFNIDIVEPSGGFRFNPAPFRTVLRQVNGRLAGRDYGDRPVQVMLLFPDDSNLGQVMDIAQEVRQYTDSLGYEGFQFRYAAIQ